MSHLCLTPAARQRVGDGRAGRCCHRRAGGDERPRGRTGPSRRQVRYTMPAPTLMTRQYCHVGSRTIAYLDSVPGGSNLRTIVLLHAFPLGANMWEPQIRSIPKEWRLITP